MNYYVKRRDAYKAARQVIRDAMALGSLDEVTIENIAKDVLKEYKDVKVDIDDLVGACLYYQDQVYPGRR